MRFIQFCFLFLLLTAFTSMDISEVDIVTEVDVTDCYITDCDILETEIAQQEMAEQKMAEKAITEKKIPKKDKPLKLNIPKNLKAKPYKFKYEDIIEEPKISNLKMIAEVGRFGVEGATQTERNYGKILRALRFQNVSRKVEEKYGLPKNLILAMVIQETGGADMLPNGLDDGGLGICHMQPSIAKSFGLSTYKGCDKLVCKKHGQALRRLINQSKQNKKELIKYDDRFHQLINLDAVGRMITAYKYPKAKGKTEWQTAILRYAGKYNYSKYSTNVNYYRKLLNDPNYINRVRLAFNKLNKNLLINGEKGDFDSYIKSQQDLNINYGLEDYK